MDGEMKIGGFTVSAVTSAVLQCYISSGTVLCLFCSMHLTSVHPTSVLLHPGSLRILFDDLFVLPIRVLELIMLIQVLVTTVFAFDLQVLTVFNCLIQMAKGYAPLSRS